MTAAPISEFPYVEVFLDVLLRHGRKHITTDRYRQILGMILRGLHDMGRTTDPHKISEEDVSVSLHTTTHPQDRLIIYLGSAYGLRRGEMAALKLDDLGPDMMVIHGKGHGVEGKIRRVPLLPHDPEIARYLEWRRRAAGGCLEDRSDGTLLVYTGAGRVLRPATATWVGDRARAIFQHSGIDATSHSLRRCFVTSAYDAGAKLVDIMRVVGHESYNTTVKYISDDPRRAAQVVALRNGYISHNGYVSNEREFESRNI